MSGLVDRVDVEGWLGRGIDAARNELAVKQSTASDTTQMVMLESGGAALEVLAERPGFVAALAHVGRAAAKSVLAQLGAGKTEEARRTYLAHHATAAELIAQVYADADATGRATAATKAAWDEVEAGALEAGALALKVAMPFLLAALAI